MYFPSYLRQFLPSFNQFLKLFSSFLPLTASSVLLTHIIFTGSCNPVTCYKIWGCLFLFLEERRTESSLLFSFYIFFQTCISPPSVFLYPLIWEQGKDLRVLPVGRFAFLLVAAQAQLAVSSRSALALKCSKLWWIFTRWMWPRRNHTHVHILSFCSRQQ